MEHSVNPDMEWYLSVSQTLAVTPRCPFASVERCPRYYQSLSLLGEAGSTKISEDEERRLQKRWEGSEFWPRTGEYATAISGNGVKQISFSNFCPEIIFDRFGFFASDIHDFYDEIDRDFAHRQCTEQRLPPKNWRLNWSALTPRHFSECALYSPLLHSQNDAKKDQPAKPKGESADMITLKPTFMGMSLDINQIVRRVWPWLRKQLGMKT